MSERWIEEEVKSALDEDYRPAPWLLSNAIAAVSAIPRRGQSACLGCRHRGCLARRQLDCRL